MVGFMQCIQTIMNYFNNLGGRLQAIYSNNNVLFSILLINKDICEIKKRRHFCSKLGKLCF